MILDILRTRLAQGHRTMAFPDGPPPPLPDRFRGRLNVTGACPADCAVCVDVCPTDALRMGESRPRIDAGLCTYCTECTAACPEGQLQWTPEYRLASRTRAGLVDSDGALHLAEKLDGALLRLLGRSLKLRQVSAGGCNACEADVNVLGTIGWDLGRFGIQMVASPRHADGLLITGPVTQNMRLALEKTYAAVPSPKIVIAVGACAISGGLFAGHPEQCDGAASVVPVDLFIPGCPPHPLTILDGLLRLLGREGK